MDEHQQVGMTRAPDVYVPPPPEATLGNVLRDSITIYLRHLIPILLMTAIVFVPFALIQIHDINRMWEDPEALKRIAGDASGRSPWIPIIGLCLQFVLQGFVIYIVVQHLNGRPPRAGDALKIGVTRMLPTLAVVICIALIFAAMILPAMAVPALGLILMIPIIFVGCGLFVSIAASVIERPGIFGALSRSWELTRGKRGMIFLLLVVVLVFVGIVSRLLRHGIEDGLTMENWLSRLRLATWLDTSILGVFYSFLAVCAGVTYHHLRTSKEGANAEELAAIFD